MGKSVPHPCKHTGLYALRALYDVCSKTCGRYSTEKLLVFATPDFWVLTARGAA
ncbi:MAG: hypothetical protein PUF61_05995 [Spirochaetales bacterium]|nr:hypothetical protein [Spirochaetales bacterium]